MKRIPVLLAVLLLTVTAVADGARRLAIHTPDDLLLAETPNSLAAQPPIEQEYVWFGGRPVAQFDSSSNAVRFTFADHLETPLLQTAAAGEVVWRAELEPYGAVSVFRTGAGLHQPLRFPGQESDGDELTYNQQRWYRSEWGRYSQADPLGVRGSVNLFQYADSRPTMRVDPTGLYTVGDSCAGNEAWINNGMQDAQRGILRCHGLDCYKKRRVLDRLMDAHIECDPTLRTGDGKAACGKTGIFSHKIVLGAILNGSKGCACMPALLAHEATHQFSILYSEYVAEAVENLCFPQCATQDNPPPSPPPRVWVGGIENR